MASVGELCPACFTGALQLHEGMLVCDVCGSIHQGFAEEAHEYQTGISDARFFKKSEGMGRAQGPKADAEVEPPPPPPVAEALRAYIKAIQQLLQRQARTLVESFGMDPGLVGVVRELWLAYLAHSKLLEPATILKFEGLAEGGSHASSDGGGDGGSGGGDSSGDEGDDAGGVVGRKRLPKQLSHNRRSTRIQNELEPVLQLRHTLVLLLLGCWQQQEAANPLDIARWALDRRLPYLSFPVDEGAVLQQYSNILGQDLLTPKGVAPARSLHVHAIQLAQKLGLDGCCPPLNPALWLHRYFAELELAQELLPVALQLHTLYQPTPLSPLFATRLNRHSWAFIMATLVVTVKVCYGMDSSPRSLPGLPPPPAWNDWAQRQLSKLSSMSAFPLTLNEAVQLDDDGLQAYLQYLQRGLFASYSPPADLDTVHQLFQQLALTLPAGRDASGAGGSSEPQAAGTSAAADVAAEPSICRQEADGSLQAAQVTAGSDGVAAMEADGPAGTLEEAAAAGQQAQAQYAYRFYGQGFWSRMLLHPHYAILLTACAPLVWLTPESLHELVVGLEHRMIAAECEVSHLYNAVEQARLARVREEAAWQKQQEERNAELQQRRRRQQARPA